MVLKQKIKINKKWLYLSGLVLFANLLFLPKQAKPVQIGEGKVMTQAEQQQDQEQQQVVNEISQQIEDKQSKIDELNQQIDQYKKSILVKQEEALNLKNEISLVDTRISKKELDIQAQQEIIDKLKLEITNLESQISDKEDEITNEKGDLGVIIRKMYEYDQKTYLEIAIGENSFSDFLTQVQYIEELESNTKSKLDHLKALRETLEGQKTNVGDKKNDVESEKSKLEAEKTDLEGELSYKDQVLFDTQLDEDKFQQLVKQVQQEQYQANSEITSLEREMRLRMDNEQFPGMGGEIIGGNATLAWPVSPALGISCGFHCADYPFKKWFEHSGMDIRIPQGTPVGAAASGYVVIAKNAGLGYNYILIEHGDGLATVYGHVSEIDVAPEQFVQRGEIIGLSGGMPGMPGTGKFSTGAHLHFEVRVEGIPDDPMKYLSSY